MTSFPSSEFAQAHVELWNLTFGYLKSMALQCSVSLGIPNAVHSRGGAATLSDLVALIPVPQHRKPYLPRLLIFLAATGILAAADDGDAGDTCYRLTPMSRLLVDDATVNGCTSMSPWVLSQTTKYHVTAAQHLTEWLMGEDGAAAVDMPFRMTHGGMDLWDAASVDPRYNEVFNTGMEADSHLALEFAITRCGEAFAGVSSLIDVGGGTGGAAKAIARAFPHVKCSVLDLPHVISSIQPPADAAAAVEYIPGDMMEYIPPTDAVFLMRSEGSQGFCNHLEYIMHDWSDEHCVKILSQCKRAICSQKPTGGGKVIIIDIIVGSPSKAMLEAQVSLDLLMMAVTSGKERDENEWCKIFTDAGFSHYEAKPVLGFMSIIQLYP